MQTKDTVPPGTLPGQKAGMAARSGCLAAIKVERDSEGSGWRILVVWYFCLLIAACLVLQGCSASRNNTSQAALKQNDIICLRNMWLGRDYTAQGRHELAREHYLLALAASKDAETRNIVIRELKSVEMMIKTER
jgi:hypothetical protein